MRSDNKNKRDRFTFEAMGKEWKGGKKNLGLPEISFDQSLVPGSYFIQPPAHLEAKLSVSNGVYHIFAFVSEFKTSFLEFICKPSHTSSFCSEKRIQGFDW